MLCAIARWWRRYERFAGFVVGATLFAYALSHVTAGHGPAIVADGPPRGAFVFPHGPEGRPLLRVPLGGALDFEAYWHVAAGGCENDVVSTIAQGTERKGFVLTLHDRGDFFAIGHPGHQHINRPLPAGIAPGSYRYEEEVVARCPTRTLEPVEIVDFDLEVYDPDGPVEAEIGKPDLLTPTLPEKGVLRYRESFIRFDSTPTEILLTFTSIPDKKVIVRQRMGAMKTEGKFEGVEIAESLPEGVTPGKWRLTKTAISTRPGGKTRTDRLFEIEFEVVP